MSSKYRYIASIFFKFGEVIDEYCVYKRVSAFSPFCFYYLSLLILFIKSEHPFYKKANLWILGALTDFIWSFYENLVLVKVQNVHP